MIIWDTRARIITQDKLTATLATMNESEVIPGTNLHGIYHEVSSWFVTQTDFARDNFNTFLNTEKDFDPSKSEMIQKKEPGRKIVNPMKDMDAILKYIRNLNYSHAVNHKAEHSLTKRNLQDVAWTSHEDDEFNTITEGELLLEERELTPREKEELISKLPYCLKSFIDKGRSLGVHAMSFLQYIHINFKTTTELRNFAPNFFLGYVYTCHPLTGKAYKLIEKQTTGHYSDFVTWLNGIAPDNAYTDYRSLLYILDKLNIDVSLDKNIMEMGDEFANSLITCYITPNSQLVSRNISCSKGVASFIDMKIRQKIYNLSLEDYLSKSFSLDNYLSTTPIDSLSIIRMMVNGISRVKRTNKAHHDIMFTKDDARTNKLINILRRTLILVTPPSLIGWDEDGFAYDMGTDTLICLNVQKYCQHLQVSEQKAILHNSGTLFLLRDLDNMVNKKGVYQTYFLTGDEAEFVFVKGSGYYVESEGNYNPGEWRTCII